MENNQTLTDGDIIVKSTEAKETNIIMNTYQSNASETEHHDL